LKKNGYALLITLFLIISIGIILSNILSITDQSIKESRDFEKTVQLNLLTQDIINILRVSPELKDINDSEDFDDMLTQISYITFPLSQNNEISIDISPLGKTFNINQIAKWRSTKKIDFMNYLRDKGVTSADYFCNLLKDIVDTKSNLTDIKSDLPYLNAHSIETWRDFRAIQEYYSKNTKDYSIFNVPWRKIIGFRGDSPNLNYISCEIWRLMFPQNPILGDKICKKKEIVKDFEELDLSKEDKKKLKLYGIKTFIPKIFVKIKLSSKDKNGTMSTFDYDLSSQKVSDVSMAL